MSTVGNVVQIHKPLKFHWSAYWKTWSRVLSTDHNDGHWVELDLTPIGREDSVPGKWRSDWSRIKRLCIRVMQKPTQQQLEKDLITDELPFAWLMDILRNVGGLLEHRLYNDDFYNQIDWSKFAVYDDGGAPFELIKKG